LTIHLGIYYNTFTDQTNFGATPTNLHALSMYRLQIDELTVQCSNCYYVNNTKCKQISAIRTKFNLIFNQHHNLLLIWCHSIMAEFITAKLQNLVKLVK